MPDLPPELYALSHGALLSALAWMARMWAAERAERKDEATKRESYSERLIVALERANTIGASFLDFLQRYEADEVVPPSSRRGRR